MKDYGKMKDYGTNEKLIEAWLAQSSESGRTCGKTLRFFGPTLYSYGCAIARQMPDGTVQLTTEKFSVTTSKHCALVRRAVPKNRFFTVTRLEI